MEAKKRIQPPRTLRGNKTRRDEPLKQKTRRLSPQHKQPKNPRSPRDTTPYVVNGETVAHPQITSQQEETREDKNVPEKREEEQEERLIIRPASPERVNLDLNNEPERRTVIKKIQKQEQSSPKKVVAKPQKREETPIPAKKKVTISKVNRNSEKDKKPAKGKKAKKPPPKKLPIPDFAKMDKAQRNGVLANFRKRFGNIQQAFPELNVGTIPSDMEATPDNLKALHKEYDEYMNHILVSEDVSQNMIILIIVLAGIELFLTKVLHLPASNYVLKQFKLIGKYRSLLYELGEERITQGGGRSPPLARIIHTILLTSVATIGIRLFASTIGETSANVAEDAIYSFLSGGGADMSRGDNPVEGNGFDISSLLKLAGNFLGGNNNGQANSSGAQTSTRGPAFNE